MLRKSAIWCKLFSKNHILVKISNFLKKSKKKSAYFCEVLLYELSEREPGLRFTARCHHRSLPVTEPGWIGLTLDPRRSMAMVVGLIILVMIDIMSYWFVTFKAFKIEWSQILREYQFRCSTKPL